MMIFLLFHRQHRNESSTVKWTENMKKSSIAIIDLGRCPHSLFLCDRHEYSPCRCANVSEGSDGQISSTTCSCLMPLFTLLNPFRFVACRSSLFLSPSHSVRTADDLRQKTILLHFLQRTQFEIILTPFWDEAGMCRVETEREREKWKRRRSY